MNISELLCSSHPRNGNRELRWAVAKKPIVHTVEQKSCFDGLALLAEAASNWDSMNNRLAKKNLCHIHSEDDEDEEKLKPKRKRASATQLETLKRVFRQTPFPTTECRRKLAKSLGMTPRSVQIWFQNQRQLSRNIMYSASNSSSSSCVSSMKTEKSP
jgi:hypothetical protein